MSPTPEQLQGLHGFGLSEYQSQAYLALLGLGETDARAVSGQGKVPLGKVYAVLEQLEQKGFVRKTAERPRRFTAIPMEQVVEQARNEHLRRADELEAAKAALSALFPAASMPMAADDRGTVLLLRGRKNVAERMRNLVAEAADVLFVAPEGLVRRRSLVTLLANAPGRVRVLAPAIDDAQALLPGVEVRQRSGGEATGILATGSATLLVHFIPDDESAHKGKDIGVLVEERALVQTIRSLFEVAWENAQAPATVSVRPSKELPAL